MVEKKTTVQITYGSMNDIHVRIERRESDKGELFTKCVTIVNHGDYRFFELSGDDALKLYEILDEIVKDGFLKCTC